MLHVILVHTVALKICSAFFKWLTEEDRIWSSNLGLQNKSAVTRVVILGTRHEGPRACRGCTGGCGEKEVAAQ